jgi:homogentisate 1,2-dioxygenase
VDVLGARLRADHRRHPPAAAVTYVSGKFGPPRGVDVGSITLHPSGLPHGPQPGLAEKSIGMHETHELAVMCDTFYPLKLSKFAKDLDDGKYAYSWYEAAQEGAGAEEASVASVACDASGAGLTSHF